MHMLTWLRSRSFRLVLCLVVLGFGLISAAASAFPILSLDTDPGTPGVQPDVEVAVGQRFMLEVRIEGVDAGTPINGFELDLRYQGLGADPVLQALSIEAGSFLTGTPILLPQDLGPPALSYALGSFGTGDSGAGVLVRIEFEAIAPGLSSLVLENVVLGQPFPATGALAWERLDGASIQVVPEPSSALLVLLGLGLIAVRQSRA